MKKIILCLTVFLAVFIFASCKENTEKAPEATVNNDVSDLPEATETGDLSFYLGVDGTYCVDGIGTYTGSEVVIPSEYQGIAVTGIAEKAFLGCGNIRSVIVPDSVTQIGGGAFSGCTSLENITLPFVGAQKYESENASRGKKMSIFPLGYIFGSVRYKGSIEVMTPVKVNEISSYQTRNVSYYIPESLKTVTVTGGNISSQAFFGCTSLTSLTLPESVTEIGSKAFGKCAALTDIYYGGTVSEWEKITFGSDFDTEAGIYTVHCTDGDVNK